MKKIILFGVMLISTVMVAQSKPKGMKEQRDSIFTVMQLSDANRQKMHDVISERGKGLKTIKEDATLTNEMKQEKLKTFSSEMKAKEQAIMTPEQLQIWKDFIKSLNNKPKQ